MFEEILAQCAAQRDAFAENVQDDFGRSILEDIYEPLLREISGMRERESRVRERCAHILASLPGNDDYQRTFVK